MTARPWPIGRLPIEEPEYWSTLGTIPASSPGRSMPVGSENPKRRTQASNFAVPSFSPIVTVPTFDDWARMSATVSVPPPPSCASWIVRSATRIVGPIVNFVRGVTSLSSIAPATVNALKVEPGSYVKPTARFWRAYSGASSMLFASMRGQLAIASTSPLRGSITTAVAPRGW